MTQAVFYQHIISANIVKKIQHESPEKRWSDFLTREEEVSAELERRVRPVVELMELQLDAAMRERKRSTTKAILWLRKAANVWGGAISPIAACESGCSACCHISVTLLASEAAMIGKEIGRMPNEVPVEKRNARPSMRRGAGYACPFLVEDSCSIYAQRPVACRLLLNIDRDALLCQHRETQDLVPYVDARVFELRLAASANLEKDYTADIRDFFS